MRYCRPSLNAITKAGMSGRPWFLYLIECKDGSIYTGVTVDVETRFRAHVSGKGAKYTRAHIPSRVLGWRRFPDRSSAQKVEYEVKQWPAEKKRAFAQVLMAEIDFAEKQ